MKLKIGEVSVILKTSEELNEIVKNFMEVFVFIPNKYEDHYNYLALKVQYFFFLSIGKGGKEKTTMHICMRIDPF